MDFHFQVQLVRCQMRTARRLVRPAVLSRFAILSRLAIVSRPPVLSWVWAGYWLQ